LKDTFYTLKTTINGQLLISLITEKVIENSRSNIIQLNTDGVSFLTHKEDKEKVLELCKEWELLTKLELEINYYKKMIIKDCNNYIWIKDDGTIKRKGAYEYKLDWDKDHSMLVVPKAVENYYLTGQSIEDFIINHEDIYDFFIRGKIDDRFELVHRFENQDIPCQKLIRYFVSNTGGTLIKIKKETGGESNLQKGWLTIIANDLRSLDLQELKKEINYQYYITEANKLLL
jgi:hypothetical protein